MSMVVAPIVWCVQAPEKRNISRYGQYKAYVYDQERSCEDCFESDELVLLNAPLLGVVSLIDELPSDDVEIGGQVIHVAELKEKVLRIFSAMIDGAPSIDVIDDIFGCDRLDPLCNRVKDAVKELLSPADDPYNPGML